MDNNALQDTAEESIKFAIVGMSGVGVNFIGLSFGLYILNASDQIALAIGIILSMTTNYLLNRVWTFHSDNQIITQYGKYILSNSVGIVIQYSIALLLERFFERIGFTQLDLLIFNLPSIYLASMTGILVGFVTNFIFSKFFVFN